MEVARLTPAQARARFRRGEKVPTAGWCAGWTQANLIAVPEEYAGDLERFARLNPAACPLVDVGEPGAHSTRWFPGDLRTDLPGYRVYRDGVAQEHAEVTGQWREDLVPFLIGCSFTFEEALLAAGVPVRHLELGRNVTMFVTSIVCEPAGRISGPMVVSMRPIPDHLVPAAIEVSRRFPHAHGEPVHVGSPEEIAINLDKPDFGDFVEVRPGETPVFWACGVTPQVAIMVSGVPYAIAHLPGHMAITDLPADRPPGEVRQAARPL